MKKILIGIIAINLTFISALALSSVGTVPAQDLNPLDAKTDPVIDEGEDSGEAEDLNLINSETTGTITATVGDGEEDPE